MGPEYAYLFYALCVLSGLYLGYLHRKGDYIVPILWTVILVLTQSPYLLIALVCYGLGMGFKAFKNMNESQDKNNE